MSLCLISYALHHGHVSGSEYNSRLWHQKEIIGQLHVTVVLPPGKGSLISIGNEDGRDQEPIWTLWSKEKSLLCQK
jgi:hypothetical protein